MVQWQGREDGILGLPFVEGMKCIPLPEPIKLQLYENIFLNCTPLFCDRTVVMLLMLLVVFSPVQVYVRTCENCKSVGMADRGARGAGGSPAGPAQPRPLPPPPDPQPRLSRHRCRPPEDRRLSRVSA